MNKLINGIINFRKSSQKKYCQKLAKLADGQSPHTLLISCSDSRVVPNIFTSQDPGDLFILRNIGNLVPPYQTEPSENSVTAALEYSIFKLKVSNIVVCGHSGCGAMAASLENKLPAELKSTESWLQYAKPAKQKLTEDFLVTPDLTPQDRLSQINVVQQLEHLKSYLYIAERLKDESLKIEGWWFDLKTADLYRYKPKTKKFVEFDQEA